MSVPFPPIVHGDGFAGLLEAARQLVDSQRERAAGSGIGSYLPIEGTEVIPVSVSAMFNWVTFYACLLTSVSPDGTYFEPTDYPFDGKLVPPSLAADRVFELAGIPLGFRRATQWDPDVNDWTHYTDAMFSHTEGCPVPGDIFGPWIIVDARRFVSQLQWCWQPADFTRLNAESEWGQSVAFGFSTTLSCSCDVYLKDRGTGLLTLVESQGAAQTETRVSQLYAWDYYAGPAYWVCKYEFTYSGEVAP